MGLDMYAYVANPGQRYEYWEGAKFDQDTGEFINITTSAPRQIAYWRKHPNLHGWMCNLWMARGLGCDADSFNGIELELTWDDIDALEKTVRARDLPDTQGFFFGDPADTHYYKDDLQFCVDAKAETFLGLKVFYNSSW